MNRRKGEKVCYRCHQPKEKYNTNGYCLDCDRQRHRERLAAAREQDKDYVNRHIQRREKEAEIEATLQRVEREPDSQDREMSFADIKFNSLDPEPVFRDLTNYFQRPQTKVSFWKTA